MRIASFTMIGQFPDGISLHIRNLKWALTKQDHIFIVTLPKYIEKFSLKNDEIVTFIPFQHEREGFIDFWSEFPAILKETGARPEWYLFMEQDIWFRRPLVNLPKNEKEIRNYLPLQNDYHAVMSGGKLFHPRVWEGANLLHKNVIEGAIDRNIHFSFTNQFFCDIDGEITLNRFVRPDTFDEMSLFCALEAKTKPIYEDGAVHLRGPESLHRQFPELYSDCIEEKLKEAQEKLNYLCVYAALAFYYVAGNWKNPLDWGKMHEKYREEYRKVMNTATEWMTKEEYEKLCNIFKV